MNKILVLSIVLAFSTFSFMSAQENYLTGIELSIDQDHLGDLVVGDPLYDRNYTIGFRLGFYGEYANSTYLGLPFIREKVDGFLIDNLLWNMGFQYDQVSHNFTFEVNGFSPMHVNDTIPEYEMAVGNGYSLSQDRPFSSFTGFRSTRRLQVYKYIPHSAGRLDLAVNSSFTFGFMSLGLAGSLDDLFGASRPDPILWSNDNSNPNPTGQLMPGGFPVFMYAISAEAVVWRPIKKVLFQLRPEISLGSYTNVGVGLDFGKVMNVERHIDNLSYTDIHNPGLLVVSDEYIGLSLVGGVMARAVFYNAHLDRLITSKQDEYESLMNTKTLVFEGYVGVKLQLFKKLEFNFSINRRSSEISSPFSRAATWGTFGMKYLLAESGEGCYD